MIQMKHETITFEDFENEFNAKGCMKFESEEQDWSKTSIPFKIEMKLDQLQLGKYVPTFVQLSDANSANIIRVSCIKSIYKYTYTDGELRYKLQCQVAHSPTKTTEYNITLTC